MNTFIPSANIVDCPKYLDKRRCFKQLVECKQILDVLDGKSEGWKNHPAIKMWVGYRDCLQWYYNIFYDYCVEVHKIKIKKLPEPELLPKMMMYPIWWGYQPIHTSHIENLCRKAMEDWNKHHNLNLANALISQGIDLAHTKIANRYIWPVLKCGCLLSEIEEAICAKQFSSKT